MLRLRFCLLLTMLILVFAACNRPAKPDDGNKANGANRPPSSTATPVKTTPTTDNTAIETIYTELDGKGCKTVNLNEEIGASDTVCEGLAGYKLSVEDFDARMDLTVIDPAGKKYKLDFAEKTGEASFSAIANKVEWRVIKNNGKVVPVGLIVRWNASNPEDSQKTTSYLMVSKITEKESCVVGVIKPSATANEEARKLADIATTKPCL